MHVIFVAQRGLLRKRADHASQRAPSRLEQGKKLKLCVTRHGAALDALGFRNVATSLTGTPHVELGHVTTKAQAWQG